MLGGRGVMGRGEEWRKGKVRIVVLNPVYDTYGEAHARLGNSEFLGSKPHFFGSKSSLSG